MPGINLEKRVRKLCGLILVQHLERIHDPEYPDEQARIPKQLGAHTPESRQFHQRRVLGQADAGGGQKHPPAYGDRVIDAKLLREHFCEKGGAEYRLPLIESETGAARHRENGPCLRLRKAEDLLLAQTGDRSDQGIRLGGTVSQIEPAAEQICIRAQHTDEGVHRHGLSMRGFQIAKDYRLGGHPQISSHRVSIRRLPWPGPLALPAMRGRSSIANSRTTF